MIRLNYKRSDDAVPLYAINAKFIDPSRIKCSFCDGV